MNALLSALERRTLIFKLALVISVLFSIALCLGVLSIRTQLKLSKQMQETFELDMLGVSNVKDAQFAYAVMGRSLRQALIAKDGAARDAAIQQLNEAEANLNKEIAELRPRVFREDVKADLNRFTQDLAIYQRKVNSAKAQVLQGDVAGATTSVASAEFAQAGYDASAAMSSLAKRKEAGAHEAVEAAQALAEANARRIFVFLSAALALGLGLAWITVLSIRRPFERVRTVVDELAAGNLDAKLPHSEFTNEIGGLVRSIQVLQTGARQMEEQSWLKSNLSTLSNALQTARTFAELSQTLFSTMGPLLKIGHGVFYIYEEEAQRLRLLGSYAMRERKSLDQYFAMGQGLVGQCAMERTPIILTQPPADYVRIGSSLGDATPSAIAVLPILRNDRLLGVLELATFASFGAKEQSLLDGLMPVLAMNLEILERSVKTTKLLEETQRQAATLEEQAVELEAQKDAIQATEAWYRGIIESAPDGLLVANGQGVITLVNPRIVDLFGYSEAELVGQPIEMLVPASRRGGHVAQRGRFMQLGAPRDMGGSNRELSGLRKDGTEFPVEVGLSQLPAMDGRGVFVCAAVRDVTERKAHAAQLLESQQRLDLALRGGNLGLWDWQAQPDVLITNDLWAEMLGYTRAEMDALYDNTAARWANMVWPEDLDRAIANFTRFVQGEIPDYRIEMRMKTKSGAPLWVLAVGGAAGRDEAGKVSRMVGIHQDISERKAAEIEVLRAKEIAEEATKAKSDFLANMSHEIRTPMNAIIGMSHLALQTNLDKRQRNYVEKVHRAGENLLGIINDILDFSKIEAGKMTMETIDFRLEDVMDNLANLVGMKAEDKGLELLFDAAADVPTALQGDPLRLGQVLINLGNNAVKFTDRGEIVVGIEKVSEDASGVELHFWVKDSGIGMTAEQCGKMFQSFSQADASTTRKYGGTGLGLAISKNLVEAMQGRIWVESELGKGSSFHFNVRLGVQANPQARRMFMAEELLGIRVLVVDDNASAREILSTMARTFGLEVDVAWDGTQALRMIAESDQKALPYDLVLMDWKMPVMDGVETVRQLQSEQLSRIPTVIMVTAYGREEAMGSAQNRGVQLNAVLTKPVTSSTLLEAIGETLGKGTITETRASEKAGTHTEVMAQLAGARVLLVEDNDMNQELAMELLRNAGLEVVLANHGQEALDILSRDANFDGVLMDCQMPVMDGYTATREIRKNPAFKDLPVVAMTANAMAGDREKVLDAGMWDHIAKPLNVGDMFATMAKWIKPKAPSAGQGAMQLIAINPSGTSANPVFDSDFCLSGIDTRAGLATSAGNQALYVRLLTKFRDSQGDFAALFAAARADADPTAAARSAHTLKGTAGNIGATGVQGAVGALEQACLAGSDPQAINALLADVVAQLAPVLAGLQGLGGPVVEAEPRADAATADAASEVREVPGAQVKALLQTLVRLLKDGDIEAADTVDALLDLAAGTPLAPKLKQVATAVADCDFDAALAALQQEGLA